MTDIFKNEIADYLNISSNNIFLFWKGRVALYAILKALGIKENDEIIIPAFTCVVVPNAIIYLGAKPVYVDIDEKTYTIDVTKIQKKITSKTKAIIAQNTFGLSPDFDTIFDIARKNNLFVIDDCTHGFGGKYKNKLNGTIADASFFSTQWNKPFSTGIGGFAVVKDKILAEKLSEIEKLSNQPSVKDEFVLKSLMKIKNNILTPSSYWKLIRIYRYLSEKNLIIGSSQGNEMVRPVLPINFLKGMSNFQKSRGFLEIKNINKYNEHRKMLATRYGKILKDLDIQIPFIPDYAEHIFLKYPLLVKDRNIFLYEAENNKIEIGDWFISPIHPIEKNFEFWNYNLGQNPVAEYISAHIVNLPTHQKVDGNYIDRISHFLKNQKYNLL